MESEDKILIVTGAYPPDVCGVGDYLQNIMLTDPAKSWRLYYRRNWNVLMLPIIMIQILRYGIRNIIIQYPSAGYGKSPIPHMLVPILRWVFNKKIIIALHEYSSFRSRGKFFINHFFRYANIIVFTSDFEKKAYMLANSKRPISNQVIPILPNIPLLKKNIKPIDQRKIDLGYFGHIRPNKGLEDFCAVASKLIEKDSELKVQICGQIPEGYSAFFKELRQKWPKLEGCYKIGLCYDEVSEFIGNTKIFFLPFPDGVSERRGSLLAALEHQSYVVSYDGPFSTSQLKEAVVIVTIENAENTVKDLLRHSDVGRLSASKSFFSSRSVHTWEDVARAYRNALVSLH